MKAIKRIENVIKNEEKIQEEIISPLFKNISSYIHGMEEIDTQKHIKEIRNIIKNYRHKDISINNIRFYTSDWNDKKIIDEYYNERGIFIVFDVRGVFDGEASCRIGEGTKGGSTPIYYYRSYVDKIENYRLIRLKTKLRELCNQEFINGIIDLCFKDKIYVTYDDRYKNYEIWDKKPNEYSNCISGYFDLKENKISTIRHLKGLLKCDDVNKYAKSKMYGESREIKWVEYTL